MKRVLQRIQVSVAIAIIFTAAASGTLAADDSLNKFQSDNDVSGKDSAPSQIEIITR
jgi:hypothetical protein